MKFTAALLALLVAPAASIDLTPDNYDAKTAGKVLFVKMFAPWCGHCKKMKPDWDKLMGEFEGHASTLVADVDCTAEGKPICDANGVKGFPTLKYGDPSDLQDYKGGRDYAALSKFATELKPQCSPSNLDLCDDAKKAEITRLQGLVGPELDALIAAEDKKLVEAEENFKAEVQKLQEKYQSLMAEKEATDAAVMASGLGLMKSVRAVAAKGGHDEL